LGLLCLFKITTLDLVGPAFEQFLDRRPAVQLWLGCTILGGIFFGSVALKPFTIPVIAGFSSWILFFVLGKEIWYRRGRNR
jgi:hypothetical protein